MLKAYIIIYPHMIAYNKKYIALWDNDDEGTEYYKKSLKAFGKIEESKLLVLPNLSRKKKVRMEEMFEKDDLKKLALYLEMPENSSYFNIMTSIICSDDETIQECTNIISTNTKEIFKKLYDMIDSIYSKKIVIQKEEKTKELVGSI